MNRPLVLNTRPRGQAAALSDALRARGFEPMEAPTVQVVAAWSQADAARVLGRLRAEDYGWAVFASANAVRFCVAGLEAAGGGTSDLATSRVLCGTATAAALRRVEIMPALVLERFSAAAALDALAAQPPERAALVPRAEEGRDELIEGLRARGTEVDAPVVYRTAPVAPMALEDAARRLRAGEIAAVTFASPSAVRGLVDGLRVLGDDPATLLRRSGVVCIGSTTAAEATRRGLAVGAIADRSSADSLADAVAALLAAAPAEQGAPTR